MIANVWCCSLCYNPTYFLLLCYISGQQGGWCFSIKRKKSPFSWQMPIWLTWYSPLEFDYVALLQLRYCLFFCGAKYDSRKQASPRWYTIPNTIFPPHLRTWLDWRNTWENWNIMALLLAGTFIPFNKRKLCSSSQLSFLFIKVRLESLCLGFFRNNCKTDKTSTLFAFFLAKIYVKSLSAVIW